MSPAFAGRTKWSFFSTRLIATAILLGLAAPAGAAVVNAPGDGPIQRVSAADFAQPVSSRPSRAAGAPTATGRLTGKPVKVHIDIVEGTKIKVNTLIHLRVSSPVSGSLVIFSENPDGTAYKLYPSKAFPGPDGRFDAVRIEACKGLRIPSATQNKQGYGIMIQPPLGMNHLYAIVVPEDRRIGEIVAEHSDGDLVRDLPILIPLIVGPAGDEAVRRRRADRGSGQLAYEIVE